MGSRQRISHRGLRDLASLAEKQGWEVTFTHGGHLRWRPPKGECVITSSTPDTKLSFDRAKIDLKMAGLLTTKAELRDHEKSQRPDTEGQDVADLYCCRNAPHGCSERFDSQYSRDRHEESCDHRQLRTPRSEGQLERDRERVPCPVPGCRVTPNPTRKNLPAHVRKVHGAEGWTWERGRGRHTAGRAVPPAHTPIEPLRARPDLLPPEVPLLVPIRPGQEAVRVYESTEQDNDALIDLMIETVFPGGLPVRNPQVLRALADWSEATNKFLDSVREAM